MHYFWLWIIFFAKSWTFLDKALLGKLRWHIFATIAERQIALPWWLCLYLAAYIPTGPRVGWTTIRPRWVEHLSHNPNSEGIAEHHWNQLKVKQKCVLEIRNRLSDLCEHNRCVGTYPTLTPMPVPVFKREACGSYWHTYIIHAIADKMVFRWWDLCRFGILKKISYLYVAIESHAYRKRHVQLYSPEMERCSRTDASPDIAQRKEKEVPQERPEKSFRHHYEEPAVECGRHRNGLIR